MQRRHGLAPLVAAALVLAAPWSAWADDEGPSPQEACKRALKAIAEQRSFAMDVECAGGLADSPNKLRADRPMVTRSYRTSIYRPIMRVDDPQAFAIYGERKGASHENGWRTLMAGERSREIPFLVRPPEVVLRTALRYARKHGVWLDDATDSEEWRKAGDEAEDARADANADGPTLSREDAAAAERSASPRTPTRLRVVGPPEVAVKLTVEVQNSGCLSGG